MKFKFSLEKVLKHRQIQVDLARRDFLEAQNILDLATQLRDEMIQKKSEVLMKRSETIQSSSGWQEEVSQLNEFIQGQDLRIVRQNESLKKLEKEVQSRREILLKALTEAKMIERLREKKKEQFIKNFNDVEQKELDEIASLRYARVEK